MLGRDQDFTGMQRLRKGCVSRLARLSLNPQPLILKLHSSDNQRHLPLLAHSLAMRHPAIGMRA